MGDVALALEGLAALAAWATDEVGEDPQHPLPPASTTHHRVTIPLHAALLLFATGIRDELADAAGHRDALADRLDALAAQVAKDLAAAEKARAGLDAQVKALATRVAALEKKPKRKDDDD